MWTHEAKTNKLKYAILDHAWKAYKDNKATKYEKKCSKRNKNR